MIKGCPDPEELLSVAVGDRTGIQDAEISRHVEACNACRRRVRDIRALGAVLHSMPAAARSGDCLDAEAIAALADGVESRDDNALDGDDSAMRHVAGCADCRGRLAAVARLTDDADIKSEIRVAQSRRPLRIRDWSRRKLTLSGLAAAAAAAVVLLSPLRPDASTDQLGGGAGMHREIAITATSAPGIVSPTDVADMSDSLRWTGVAQADLYRVRIWNTEGTVVWTTETRGTTAPLPSLLQAGVPYMWEVSARTGWDRWVGSAFVEFTLRPR